MISRPEERTILRISPVYEKVFKPDGHGFTGFTIFYSEDGFANHIQFFEKGTYKQISEQVSAIHAGYCKACHSVMENPELIDNKEKNL